MISSITVSWLILTISLSEIKGSDITLNDDFQYHSQLVDTDNFAEEIKGSDVTLNDDFQYHSQFVVTDNIAL
jgi:hypothetical protein